MIITFLAYCSILFAQIVSTEVVSPSHTYNVTLPVPNAPYVAGQMLPIAYTLPDDADLPKRLSLSISLTTQDPNLNFTDIVITPNADISQGFSFKRTLNTFIYYEHQLSFSIPNTTLPGNYFVVFSDSISKTNTSIPIVIRPYAPSASTSSNANKARPSGVGEGSIFAAHNNNNRSGQSRNCMANWTSALLFMLFTIIYCTLT